MGIAIMISVLIIFSVGIIKADNIIIVVSQNFQQNGFSNLPKAILNAFTYAGFQCVTLPTIIACGKVFQGQKNYGEKNPCGFLS